MLKSVTSGQSIGAVGASDDLSQIGKDDNAEAGRDYTSRIDDLIKRIQVAQNSQHSTKEGDVTEHAILEAIMTGPMVVGHWINFQYYASTVDNARYGCGDKVLHNIVGGHLGVLEGNGGDLRIGLSLQSLNDGERWVHAPLRLAVFVEAPQTTIDGVLAKHGKLAGLVDNEWLHLFQIDTAARAVAARKRGGWVETKPAA